MMPFITSPCHAQGIAREQPRPLWHRFLHSKEVQISPIRLSLPSCLGAFASLMHVAGIAGKP